MYADNLSMFFSFLSLRLCLWLRTYALSRFTRTTQRRKHNKHKHKRMEIVPFSCACACVVRVNRNDASINTSTSTRRLCLRRTSLHVGFLCLCLCLRRTCKPCCRCPHLLKRRLWLCLCPSGAPIDSRVLLSSRRDYPEIYN